MTLSNLKKGSSLDKLKKAVEASSTGGNNKSSADDRFWQPEVDAAGNGYAVIRFLDTPAVDGEDGLPWVQIWDKKISDDIIYPKVSRKIRKYGAFLNVNVDKYKKLTKETLLGDEIDI